MLCLRRALTARLRNPRARSGTAVAQSGAAPFRLQPSLPRTAFGRAVGPAGHGSEGASGATHARRSAAPHTALATAATAAVCSLASRVTSQLCFNWTRLRGPCGSAVADTAKRTVHHAQRAPYPVPVRKLSPHVTARAVATRGTPCVYAAIAHAQNPCVSYRRVQSFLLNLTSPVSASFHPVAAVTASPPT